MEKIKIKTIKEGYITILITFLFFSAISYFTINKRENIFITVLLITVIVGVLLSFVSIAIVYLAKCKEFEIQITTLVMFFVLNMGFFNGWLIFVNDLSGEIVKLFIILLVFGVFGYCYETKKDKNRKKKEKKHNYLWSYIMAGVGVCLTRLLDIFLKQDQIVVLGKAFFEFAMMFFVFIIGIMSKRLKTNQSNNKCG